MLAVMQISNNSFFELSCKATSPRGKLKYCIHLPSDTFHLLLGVLKECQKGYITPKPSLRLPQASSWWDVSRKPLKEGNQEASQAWTTLADNIQSRRTMALWAPPDWWIPSLHFCFYFMGRGIDTAFWLQSLETLVLDLINSYLTWKPFECSYTCPNISIIAALNISSCQYTSNSFFFFLATKRSSC